MALIAEIVLFVAYADKKNCYFNYRPIYAVINHNSLYSVTKPCKTSVYHDEIPQHQKPFFSSENALNLRAAGGVKTTKRGDEFSASPFKNPRSASGHCLSLVYAIVLCCRWIFINK